MENIVYEIRRKRTFEIVENGEIRTFVVENGRLRLLVGICLSFQKETQG